MLLFFISSLIISYLIGSFSSAIYVTKRIFGKDIRNYGSGNAGATNVYRTFGPKFGFIVFVLDGLKGFFAVHLVYFIPNIADLDYSNERIGLQLCFGVAAMLGHIYPLYYNFKGGKGVATILGIILGINYAIAIGLFFVFISVVASTSYVSLGSMMAALTYPVLVIVFVDNNPFFFILVAIQTTCFIIYSHRKNIIKLINGNENRFVMRRR